jgi:type III secretory pathway component EscU
VHNFDVIMGFIIWMGVNIFFYVVLSIIDLLFLSYVFRKDNIGFAIVDFLFPEMENFH